MKKIIYILVLLLFPFIVLAYSNKIIPGGDTLGIEIKSEGVVVVGFYKVNGEYINNDLKLGDRIIKVGNDKIIDAQSLVNSIEKYAKDHIAISYIRNGTEYKSTLEVINDNNNYKTGLYIKGDLIGIGTLTYIDPENKVYGILGHSLNYSFSNEIIDILKGITYDAKVKSFTRSTNGIPGSKNAEINKNSIFGDLKHNSLYGLFGSVNKDINRDEMEVTGIENVKLGKAYILTSNQNNNIDKYEIKIIDLDKNHKDRNIFFEITDERLLECSGGIVQGMSGSPIIQDNKIIGAVTRVLIDDVKKGYGISIITMLEEGDKIK